jgi:protein-tyrosine phosphatase
MDGVRGIHPRRIVAMEGAVNFRDLGGYKTSDGKTTRWGCVYRTGSLARLTAGDLEILKNLSIKLMCDLRTDQEVHASREALDGIDTVYMSLEEENATASRLRALLFNRRQLPDLMLRFYTETAIQKNAHIFNGVFRRLADDSNLPILIRCSGGKDRTGLTSALLLLALGVDEETVIADYSLSNLYFEDFKTFARQMMKPLGFVGVTLDDLYPLLVADPSTLRHTLAYVRNHYGSVDSYLRTAAFVDEATLQQVRANLLED